MKCTGVYYKNANKIREKTDENCQLPAEWSIEWRVPPTSGVGGPSRHHMETCRHHIIQAYWDAQESGAVAGDIRLLGKDQYDDWDINARGVDE